MKKAIMFLISCLLITSFTSCSENQDNLSKDNLSKTESSTPSVLIAGGEKEIIINPGEWQLTGTLTIPDGEGPFPLVIFVHGSGPSDRDETIGKIKVFKDLSADLGKQGIASIRYDKRTYLYGTKMASDYTITVKEETIDDVLNAVDFAMNTEYINKNEIYVAGHSMGGYLIPRIDEADTENHIAGYISLAGSVRPIMDLALEQIDYILSLNDTLSESDKAAQKKQYTDAAQMIESLTPADKDTGKMIFGAYATYWLDLADYHPDQSIGNVKEPLLFLQGGNDYQVTTTDFNLWQSALKDRDNVVFKLYPNLTHSFTSTAEKGTPGDYEVYAKVDESVSKDIAGFIISQSA